MPIVLPSSDTDIARAALAMHDLVIPPECLPGVKANLALLADHLARIESETE